MLRSVNLTPPQRDLVRGLVHAAYRKAIQSRSRLMSKYGSEADLTKTDERLRQLRILWQKLDGDPAAIDQQFQPVGQEVDAEA